MGRQLRALRTIMLVVLTVWVLSWMVRFTMAAMHIAVYGGFLLFAMLTVGGAVLLGLGIAVVMRTISRT